MNLYNWISKETMGYGTVVELGSMFFDKLLHCSCPRRIGIEIHKPYVDRAPNYENCIKIHGDIRDYRQLISEEDMDLCMIIDVIEHLEKDEALRLLNSLKEDFNKIIIFAPEGNHPQTKDVTGLGADEYQTHRSTWYLCDFEAIGFEGVVDPKFHIDPNKDNGAIFVTWTKK